MADFVTTYINSRKKIPSKHRCSYCKGDMRLPLSKTYGCQCSREHPVSGNKSGNVFLITVQKYQGWFE